MIFFYAPPFAYARTTSSLRPHCRRVLLRFYYPPFVEVVGLCLMHAHLLAPFVLFLSGPSYYLFVLQTEIDESTPSFLFLSPISPCSSTDHSLNSHALMELTPL